MNWTFLLASTAALILFPLAAWLVKALYSYTLGCPAELKSIPSISLWTFLKLALTKAPETERSKLIFRSSNEEGLARLWLMGTWVVTVSTAEHNRKILNDAESCPKLEFKKIMPNSLLVRLFGENLAGANGAIWKRHRRVVAPAFHNFQAYVEVFARGAKELAEAIETERTKKMNGDGVGANVNVNVSDLFSLMTVDALSRAGFNHDLKAVKEGGGVWLKAYKKLMDGVMDPLTFLFPGLERFNINDRTGIMKRSSAHLDNLFYDLIEKRRAEIARWKRQQSEYSTDDEKEPLSRPNDLLALMILACEDYHDEKGGDAKSKSSLTAEELRNNLLLFFIAGHETTSNALASLFYYLSINPDVQAKVREECDRVMGGKGQNLEDAASYEQQKQMVYLTAVMKESLRLNCPIDGLAMRVVENPDGIFLGSQHVPSGTWIIPQIWGMHNDARVWGSDPLKFDPERYLEDEVANLEISSSTTTTKKTGSNAMTDSQRSSWMPFGAGPRACIGINFSLIEQRIVISHLVRRYTVRLPKDSKHKDGIVNTESAIIAPDTMTLIFEKHA